jgi:pentatricopeptide repeat protein
MASHDMFSWNFILGGCGMHMQGKEAINFFECMCEKGVQVNDITFVCLLSCSHVGLVDERMHCYASMSTIYMFFANLEHYICMVNLLHCVGHLQEAKK